jgi:hypothetical protein
MAKYVIYPEVALRLAVEKAVLPAEHRLLAPTLLRSQLLAQLYRSVREGNMTEYVALTKLQGDALVTLNADIVTAVANLVSVAPFEALLRPVTDS